MAPKPKPKKKKKKAFTISADLSEAVSAAQEVVEARVRRREERETSSNLGVSVPGTTTTPRRNNKGGGKKGRRRPPAPPLPPPGGPGRGCHRELLGAGVEVWVVQKHHQRSGEETRGVVDRLLTKSPYHPRGVKVLLVEDGIVGRVTRIVNDGEDRGRT